MASDLSLVLLTEIIWRSSAGLDHRGVGGSGTDFLLLFVVVVLCRLHVVLAVLVLGRVEDALAAHEGEVVAQLHPTVQVNNRSDDPSDPTRPTRQTHDRGINTGPIQCLILVNFDGLDWLSGSTHRPRYKKLTRLGKIDDLTCGRGPAPWPSPRGCRRRRPSPP